MYVVTVCVLVWVWAVWDLCSYGAGGGGAGGSILMEACNVSGAGSVTATGGQSVAGSGAGGGGRISIRAGLVSPELVDCPAMLECVCDAPVA